MKRFVNVNAKRVKHKKSENTEDDETQNELQRKIEESLTKINIYKRIINKASALASPQANEYTIFFSPIFYLS